MTRLARLATAALLLGPLLGCGGGALPTFPAGGRVEFADGTPLTTGWVEFESFATTPPLTARAPIQPDGTFQLGTYQIGDGAVAGRHRAIVAVPPSNEAADNPHAASSPIAAKFRDFAQSGLEFEVTPDAERNQFKIIVSESSN